jgi:hypothetical protein
LFLGIRSLGVEIGGATMERWKLSRRALAGLLALVPIGAVLMSSFGIEPQKCTSTYDGRLQLLERSCTSLEFIDVLPVVLLSAVLLLPDLITKHVVAFSRSLHKRGEKHHIFLLAGFTLALVVVGWVLGAWLNSSATEASGDWIKRLQFADSSYVTAALPMKVDSTPERDRLLEQFRETGGRAYMHLTIMKHFYTRYYMALVLASAAAVVAAFCLLSIAKEGFGKAGAYVQILFVIAAGTALLLGVFPKLFRQDENIVDNKAAYLQYVALGNEIRTFLATGTTVLPNDTTVTIEEFARYVDQQLSKLNTIPVGFDYTQVPDYRKLQLGPSEPQVTGASP